MAKMAVAVDMFKLIPGTLLIAVLVQLTAASCKPPKPCDCYKDWKPVCGSDGRTYTNECVLNCASQIYVENNIPPICVSSKGPCPEKECTCPAKGPPVCGSNGVTYLNKCILACENKHRETKKRDPIHVAHEGECKTFRCPNIPIPVCGSNNVTYENICFLQEASRKSQATGKGSITLKSIGECIDDRCVICPPYIDPICASDGHTYDNACLLSCKNSRRIKYRQQRLRIAHKGYCTGCNCTKEYNPVCASDGNTYSNTCFLKCKNKKRGYKHKPITVTAKGKCLNCGCKKRNDPNPVCGSDGKTYDNICSFNFENLSRISQGKHILMITNFGECRKKVECGCNDEYKPVCGDDGKIYGNICELKCESKRRENKGLCPIHPTDHHQCVKIDCVCTKIGDPVCGTDGRNYGNPCELKCENMRREKLHLSPIDIDYRGVCIVCMCPFNIAPVCGSDGITYSNECLLECEKIKRKKQRKDPITKLYDGECCVCNKKKYKPVCGSDGNTYPNIGCFNCEKLLSPNVTIAHPGACEGCACIALYDPVCGSDGKTYGNSCELGCASKRQGPGEDPLTQISKGECASVSNSTCGCAQYDDPVCASDGNTYITFINKGCLDCANVERKQKGLEELTFIHKGVCQKGCVCNKECDPDMWKPVCDNTGITHPNIDCLKCENMHRVKAGLPLLLIAKYGLCKPCFCQDIYAPVCGSDGKTYDNRCALGCETRRRKVQCKKPLYVLREGKCEFGCPRNWDPVCGSDGKTYGNKCVFDAENVARARKDWPPLTFKPGECRKTPKPAERKEAAPCETA